MSRARSRSSSAGSSIAVTPCATRLTPNSSTSRTRLAPDTSPAWAVSASPASRAATNAIACGGAGHSASGPARSNPTTGPPISPAIRASSALAAGGCERMAVTISVTRTAFDGVEARATPVATASITAATESPRSRWRRGAHRTSAYRMPSAARSSTSSAAARSSAWAVWSSAIGRSKKVSSSAWSAHRSGPTIRRDASSSVSDMPMSAASSTAVSGRTDPSRCWWSSAFGKRRMTSGSIQP